MNENTIKHIRHKPGSSLKRNDHGRCHYACNSKICLCVSTYLQKVMRKIDIIDELATTATLLSIEIGLQAVIPTNRIGT